MIDVISVVVAVIVALGTFFAWRSDQLRRGEVLEWGLKCIDQLQKLHLWCGSNTGQEKDTCMPSEYSTGISVLAEQGRMFFRNASPKDYGQQKELAYRGYRPVILDQLVFAYIVAHAWGDLPPADRAVARKVIAQCKERFVSLLQREAGRKRTADRYSKEAGSGQTLASLLTLARKGQAPTLPAEEPGTWVQVRRAMRF